MADIRPFHGIHYHPPVVGDAGRVICPPYDVISPAFQEELYHRSDFNFVRIEYGRELERDNEQENKYTRAADTMEKWLTRGILVADKEPAIYIDDHHFTNRGTNYCRRNINCLVRLEPWESKVIRPHEAIFARAKSDRLTLLYTLQANTSPIMGLFDDPKQSIPTALSKLSDVPPLFIADTGNGEYHELRAVTDAKLLTTICGVLADCPIYIADGHHRYESALTYQRERRARAVSNAGDEPYDYVMITLVDFIDPGLVILPAHRMVRDIPQHKMEQLLPGLEDFFTIRNITVAAGNEQEQLEMLLSEQDNEPLLVLFGVRPGVFSVLTIKDSVIVNSTIPYFHTDTYRTLDVSILDHVILERLLGVTADTISTHVSYTNEAMDAFHEVDSGKCQFSVFLNPVKPDIIKSIADSGDRMPRKSTYFYPKIPAGLVVYRFS